MERWKKMRKGSTVRRRRSYACLTEALEQRQLLTAVTWTGSDDGTTWTDPNNWSNHAMPNASSDVTINLGGNPTINLGSGAQTVHSLTSSDPIIISGGSLSSLTTIKITANLTLAGGNVSGGTINASGGAEVVASSSGGTLAGVTLNGNLDLTAPNANLTVTNGLTLNGTATLGSSANSYGEEGISFSGTQMLGGTGTVFFANTSYTALYLAQNSTTLTIGSGITIDGGAAPGEFGAELGGAESFFGGGTGVTLVNQGTINANVAGCQIAINPEGAGQTFTNSRTLEATGGGIIALGGNTTTLGTFNAAGGTFDLTGTLNKSGGTLALTASTGSLTLEGGTLLGGTVTETGGSELVLTGSGTLDGVTIDGLLDMTAPSLNVTIADGLTLNGTLAIGSAGNGYDIVNFSGSQTLAGTGTVVFADAPNTALYLSQDSTTLTIGSGITILGGSSQNSAFLGYSNYYYGGGENCTVINHGTINANVSGTSLSIFTGGTGETFTNNGTIEATNGGTLYVGALAGNVGIAIVNGSGSMLSLAGTGYVNNLGLIVPAGTTLDLGGTFNTAGLGTINGSAGTVNLTGTMNNSGHTFTLIAALGSWNLDGGTILGGTFNQAAGSQLMLTGAGGVIMGVTVNCNLVMPMSSSVTLDGVTLNGNLDMTATNTNLYVTDGLTLNGTMSIGNATSNEGFDIVDFTNTQTLGGNGTVLFGFAGYTATYIGQSYATLTIGPGITVTGGSSNYYGYSASLGYSNYYYGGGSNTTLINRGIINANTPGGGISIYPAGTGVTFINLGTIEATNGGVLSAGALTGNVGIAIVNGSGSTLSLGGTDYVNNLGLVVPAGAILDLGGTFTVADLGTINGYAGTVDITGTLENTGTTLALNALGGSWGLANGTIVGGAITATGGTDLIATGQDTLDGVTLDCNLDMTAGSIYMTVLDGLTLNSTITVGSIAGGGYDSLNFAGTQTLGGNGTVFFANLAYSAMYLSASSTTLTIGQGITIMGGSTQQANAQGVALGSSAFYTSGLFTTIINQGTIDADGPGDAFSIYAYGSDETFVNLGTTEVTNGGVVAIDTTEAFTNSGILNASSGIISIAPGRQQTTNTGTIVVGATSTLNITGAFTQSTSGSLDFVLGGAANGSYGQANISGQAVLAGALNISEAAGFTPAAGNNFAILSFASHVGQFTYYSGLFAGTNLQFAAGYTGSGLTLLTSTTTGQSPLILSGPAFYLKVASDGLHLDVWNSTTDTGTANQVLLLGSLSSITINGGATGTSLTVDFSAGNPTIPNGLNFNGAAGKTNTLGIVDTGDTNNATFLATANDLYVNTVYGPAAISFNNITAINIHPGSGTDLLTENALMAGTTLTYLNTTASDSLTVNSGTFTFPAANPGTGVSAITLGTLTIGTDATVRVPAPDVHTDRIMLMLNSLSIAGSDSAWLGQLDLTGNDLDIHNGDLPTISNQIQSGYNQGLWTGPGITSSTAAANPNYLTALGAVMNNNGNAQRIFGSGSALGLFDGQNPSLQDILIKFTYYGDANLDGKIDGSDYSLIDNGFLHHLSTWYNGDCNYDNIVDGSDYTLMDNTYNRQGVSLAATAAPAAQVANPRRLTATTPAMFSQSQIAPQAWQTQQINIASEIFGPDQLANHGITISSITPSC